MISGLKNGITRATNLCPRRFRGRIFQRNVKLLKPYKSTSFKQPGGYEWNLKMSVVWKAGKLKTENMEFAKKLCIRARNLYKLLMKIPYEAEIGNGTYFHYILQGHVEEMVGIL